MNHINIEIKARCSIADRVREIILSDNARTVGTAHQIDTYFLVSRGRLKLRESNIEDDELIFYERENKKGPKQSDIKIIKNPNPGIKGFLASALGILAVIDKQREIYWVGNVKFHIDQVVGLGSFIEIEAVDYEGNIGIEKLTEQCQHYLKLFGVTDPDLISESYSDLIIAKHQKP
jgi:adenylate cyclase class 2